MVQRWYFWGWSLVSEMPSTDISQENDHAILIVKCQFVACNFRSRKHPSKNVYHLTHNGIKNILNKFQLGFK